LSINPKIPKFGEPENLPEESYDAIVIGGGIAGMQAALDLGDMGKRVIIIDKEPSIGGNMFKLSKTFPTMDCASCISTPKMAAVSHHPDSDLF
jgi:heterodisulfide reductase subunit A-like polyferredoxin